MIIMDGIGIGKNDESNAVFTARTPVLDRSTTIPLKTTLITHGSSVGLPSDNDMGNSEVGHNALGAGRIFDQGSKLVKKSIESGTLFKTDLWKKIIDKGKNGRTVHFIGLLSDGNVHSHIDHLLALLNECAAQDVRNVRIHTLTDGRDVGGRSAPEYLNKTEALLSTISDSNGFDYKIASGGGRMKVTMDRYKADWDIVKCGWDTHVRGIGRQFKSALEAIETLYSEDSEVIDQFLDPFVVVSDEGEPVGKIVDGDVVIFFNFRGDRAIEISQAFEDPDFNEFDRVANPDVFYAGMLEYDGGLHIPKNYLVSPPHIDRSISEYLCAERVTSFAISETQKYGHVTYLWNGNKSGYVNESLETYVEIPSDKIQFDKAPKMKAYEITEKTIELLESEKYRFGRVNFPNGDMVGHTGVFDAAVSAVEAVDECVGRLLVTIEKLKGVALVTADHGNSDQMFKIVHDEKVVITSHSLNPVWLFIHDPLYSGEYRMADFKKRGLTNITGTILNLLGYENVEDYDRPLIDFDE